jgi:hypothetical protein
MDNIMRNINMVKNYSRFSEVKLGYWDWTKGNYTDKVSPTDLGKAKFKYILENEIKIIGDEDEDEI